MENSEADVGVGVDALVPLLNSRSERLKVHAELRCLHLNGCQDVSVQTSVGLLRVKNPFEDVSFVLELVFRLALL